MWRQVWVDLFTLRLIGERGQHHLQVLPGSSGGPWVLVSLMSKETVEMVFCLHERPAEEGNQDHRQPRRHLVETPQNVANGHSQTILLQSASERMPVSLIRLRLLVLLVDDKLLQSLAVGSIAPHREITSSWRGGGLVG